LAGALVAEEPASQLTEPLEAVGEEDPIWPHQMSDLPVDPGYVFGVLPNGMRYILRENKTPEGTALVRMRIDSGSLEETDSEQGLAHYLEHMAFNGSKGIPEGEMIKLLEREGLAFGGDTNASTGLEAITYMLNLPRNDEDLLDTALMLMRETASELTISQEAVDRERGVILAERRDRRGFQQRAFEDQIEFYAPQARFRQRLPIGILPVIENATAEDIRALYERTYTPTNTALVIVGDFPVELMEAKIKERFSDWSGPPAPEKPMTGPLDTELKAQTDIYLDDALSEAVRIERLNPYIDEPDTKATRAKSLLRTIGFDIVNRRLARLARSEEAPFRSARFDTGDIFEDARSTGISVRSVDGEWRRGTLAAVREVNQALTYGFTQAEVEEQLKRRRTAIENAVKGADTRSNAVFAGSALSIVADDTVATTPESALERFTALEATITPQAVYQAMLEYAGTIDEPLIRFTGRTAPEGGKGALRAAFSEAMALAIAPPQEKDAVSFAYTDFGSPGDVISDTREDRLGLRFITFANGVRLTLKQTDISKDRISVRLSLDGGELMNTIQDPLRTYLAGSLTSGGLGEHSQDDLSTILAGRSASLNFGPSGDVFAATGRTTPDDLELQLQLITALVIDPGYRAEGVVRFRKGIDNFFETLTATPNQAYGTAIGGILSDGDPRFSLQSKEAYFALDYDALRASISERLEQGAIELALVGDLDEEAAIAAVAATLGALPPRETEFRPREDARDRPFTAQRGQREILHDGEADQATLRLVWPTRDYRDQPEVLKLGLLARVIRLELTDRLREELGQAYSPFASSSTSRVYRDYGTLMLTASVDVAEVPATRSALMTLIEDLRAAPLPADTLDRARKPLLESYDNALKSLGGWMQLAARAQSQPDRLDRWFAAKDLILAVTPEDLQATAITYLDPQQAVELVVKPRLQAATIAAN
ncbi:MAG: insulinase family protein, partial [Pseudomonadota bacterium]